MKWFLLFSLCVALAASQEYVVLLNEDFEGGQLPPGWTKFQNNPFGWSFGTPIEWSSAGWNIPNPLNEGLGKIAVTSDDRCFCDSSLDLLTTYPINIPTTLDQVTLYFKAFYDGNDGQTATIEIGNNGVFTAALILTSSPQWQHLEIDLNTWKGQSIQVRFWGNDNGGWASGFAIDQVKIIAHNYATVNPLCATLSAPLDAAQITTGPFLLQWTRNVAEQTGLPLGYRVSYGVLNGATIATDVDVGLDLQFPSLYKMDGESYWWQVTPYGFNNNNATGCPQWTFSAASDEISGTGAYFEDFEGGKGGWLPAGSFSSWGFGNPQKRKINTASSGTNAWVTGGLGTEDYNSLETSALYSPIFDFSGRTGDSVFQMKLFYQTEYNFDGVSFEYSVDYGSTWTVFTNTTTGDSSNWYNSYNVSMIPNKAGWTGRTEEQNTGSNGWITTRHTLQNTAGQHVVIRIRIFADQRSEDDGAGVDDIFIDEIPSDAPNCATLISPADLDTTLPITSFTLRWNRTEPEHPALPTGYKLYFGTNTPPTNILNGQNLDSALSYDYNFFGPQTYYWQVVPVGYSGVEASSCPIWSFSTTVPRVSTFPYLADFENGGQSWVSSGEKNSWALGTPRKTRITNAATGTKAWVTGGLGNGTHNSEEHSWVQSPEFDFRSFVVSPWIQMNVWWESETDFDGAALQYSLDYGANWETVGTGQDSNPYANNWYTSANLSASGFPGWSGRTILGSGQWLRASHPLTGVEGSLAILRVTFDSDLFFNYDGFAFDTVEIFPEPTGIAPQCAIPVSPTPSSTIGLLPTTIQWSFNEPQDGLPIGSRLYFGTNNPPTNILNGVDMDKSVSYSTGRFNLTTYYWKVVPYGISAEASNCPVWSFTASVPIVSTFPYQENFDSITNPSGDWRVQGTNASWAVGVPGKDTIDRSYSGNRCWVTGGLGSATYNNRENSWLESPLFDFSGFTRDPVFQAYLWIDTDNNDGAVLQYSTDLGVTWSTVGTTQQLNWYTSSSILSRPGGSLQGWAGESNGWIRVHHVLPGLAGQSRVFLRIIFTSDRTRAFDGIGVDDVSVIEMPAGVPPVCASLVYPLDGSTDLSIFDFSLQWSAENEVTPGLPIGFRVYYGLGSLSTSYFDVQDRLSVKSGVKQVGTYFWQVVPYGVNNITASNCPVWSFTTNITTAVAIPYSTDLEDGAYDWEVDPGSVNPSWELGEPVKGILYGARSGVNAWVAGGVDTADIYNVNEVSFLHSPIFDFSSLSNDPIIRFAIKYSTESRFDGLCVQYSTDLLGTWVTVGSSSDSNWYSTSNIAALPGGQPQGWSGTQPDWILVNHTLTGSAGESQVIIRFAFASDDFYEFEGVAIDDIDIIPNETPVSISDSQSTQPQTSQPSQSSQSSGDTTPASSDEGSSSTTGGLGTGLIIFIVVGSLLVVAVAVGAIIFYQQKKGKPKMTMTELSDIDS